MHRKLVWQRSGRSHVCPVGDAPVAQSASFCHCTNPDVTDGDLSLSCFRRGSDLNNSGAAPQQKQLQDELSNLSATEDALDALIKDCAQQLFELTDDKENERYPFTVPL